MNRSIFFAGLAAAGLAALLVGCGESEAEARNRRADEFEREVKLSESRAAEESIRMARQEGARALDEADIAIRGDIDARRKKLRTAAVGYKLSTSRGVRLDIYTLRDGRTVICTTTVLDSGAAMSCDDEV